MRDPGVRRDFAVPGDGGKYIVDEAARDRASQRIRLKSRARRATRDTPLDTSRRAQYLYETRGEVKREIIIFIGAFSRATMTEGGRGIFSRHLAQVAV